MSTQQSILVSACLLGIPCRYDGSCAKVTLSAKSLVGLKAVSVCPESLGGLSIPRPPAEIVNGNGDQLLLGIASVIDAEGNDRSEAFRNGAQKTLALAEENGVKGAILKARSPSCGKGQIYDGTFSKTLIKGDGVAVALLEQHGIPVWNEEEWSESYESIREKYQI